MAAFKKSQNGGVGPYTSNETIGRKATGIDEFGMSKEKPYSIAKEMGAENVTNNGPIISEGGGYRQVKSGGAKRYDPI